MNNSQKTVYIIAIIAIVLLVANGVYSSRFYNGYLLKKNVMISLNTKDGHGVNIQQQADLVSFESGIVYNLQVSQFPDPEGETISVAIPIKHLKPNAKYESEFKFRMNTNSPSPVTVKSNSMISIEQTSFETDVNYKPVTINNGSKEYVIDFEFETNDEGTGFAIFDFKVDDSIDELDVALSNVVFTDFKEIEDDSVNSEQTSETSVEIV